MTTLADAFVRLRPDTSRMGPEITSGTVGPAGEAGDEAGKHFGRRMALAIGAAVVAGAVVVGRKLVGELRQSIDAASDLNETVSKVGVVFGAGAQAVNRFAAQAAKSMGQSKQEALDGAATFALYGKQAGLTGKQLVPFSTNLVKLASDMASFSNTTPQEAIEAIGAAMRGESDPIEKYNVLLNESVLKSRALKLGLIETTTQALTPQQRVLAVQAELFKQTSVAQGDFARTSAGLANQQRIAAAQAENLRTRIGTALLPVMQAFYQQINTQVIPALNELWSKHGPAVTKFLQDAATKIGPLTQKLKGVDFKKVGDQLSDLRAKAGPAMQELTDKVGPFATAMKEDVVPALKEVKDSGGTQLADTLSVTGNVMSFLADHSDLLAKALPFLAAGFVLVKTAQLASNVASAASPALRIAEVIANRRLAASNAELTAAIVAQTSTARAATGAQVAQTAATNVGIVTRIRSTAATVAHTVASGAARAATIAWTAVQWLLNAALTANPIGLVILAVAGLVAGIVIAYKKSETFRKIVQAAFHGVQVAAKFVWDWLKQNWPYLLGILLGPIALAAAAIFKNWDRIKAGATAVKNWIAARFREAKDAIVGRFNDAVAFVRGVPRRIVSALGNVSRLLLDAGRRIIQGLINGIRDKLGDLGGVMGSVAGKVRDFLPFSPAKEGPLSGRGNPFYSGQAIGRLLAAGIASRKSTVAAAVSGLVGPARSFASALLGAIRSGRASPIGGTPGALFEDFSFRGMSDSFDDALRFGVAKRLGLDFMDRAGTIRKLEAALARPAPPQRPAATDPDERLVRALERALERVLSRATLRIDDRTARFADLLVRGG